MNKQEAKREVAGWLVARTTMPEDFDNELEEFDEKTQEKLIEALEELGKEIAKRYRTDKLD